MRVVATAGHVDHGKSSLVLALTGTDPDRFPEEKERGLTIDLGFAFCDLPSGTTVGFVDVPGHVRFVKNMLAGVGAVDIALLVVASNEGWMPQSEEHFRILELLGVEHGMVVLTKRDLVDDEIAELARLDVAEHVAGTAVEAWPVVEADSRSGRGLDDVRETLDAVLDASPPPSDAGRPRLWVDRVFSPRGVGTVVTGTLTGGSLGTGEHVAVGPRALPARVRGIEVHHGVRDVAEAGERVALNLAGLGHDEIARGDAVVRPTDWLLTAVVDASVRAVPGATFPNRGTMHVHVGSGEQIATVRRLDDDHVRIRLSHALPLAPGDPMILRSPARNTTVGAARVLDLRPARRTSESLRRMALPADERALAHGWQTVDELGLAVGVGRTAGRPLADDLTRRELAIVLGDRVAPRSLVVTLREQAERRIRTFQQRQPESAGLDLAELASSLRVAPGDLRALLADDPTFVVDRDVVRTADHAPAGTVDPRAQAWLERLAAEPFNPVSPSDAHVPPALVHALARQGVVVDVEGVWFAADALTAARSIVGDAVVREGSLTVSAIRDLLGTTRKFAVPLAGWLDAQGVTRRRGDERIPGPRAGVSD
jgi:selenocysteine-specific elongation factor